MVKHKMMLPPKARGTVTWVAEPGHYTVTDKILEVEFDGEKTEYTMLQVNFFLTMNQKLISRFCFIIFIPISFDNLIIFNSNFDPAFSAVRILLHTCICCIQFKQKWINKMKCKFMNIQSYNNLF